MAMYMQIVIINKRLIFKNVRKRKIKILTNCTYTLDVLIKLVKYNTKFESNKIYENISSK